MTQAVVEGQLSPKDLYTYNGPLYVENRSHAKIFHDDMKGNQMELGPVTSETRFGVLPLEIAKSATFQKIWRMGQVRVSTDPEMEGVLMLSDHRQALAESNRVQGVLDMIDTSVEDKSLKPIVCLECKKDTFQSNRDITEGAAPLCIDHKHLSSSWILEQTFDQVKGEAVSKWTKVTVGPTVKGLPAK